MRVRAGTASLVLGLLSLGACGGPEGSAVATPTAAAAAIFNQADVDFAVAMSMHRSQGFGLAEIAEQRSRDAALRGIVARMRATDARAVDDIAGWLKDWAGFGAEVPHVHKDGPQPGVIAEEKVSRLRGTSAGRFDDVLRATIAAHRRAALPLLERQLAEGRSPQARAMAEELTTVYRSELAKLQPKGRP
ncbi:MAG: DUF305 domain-containing protein [Sporichthyaceae bacterium]